MADAQKSNQPPPKNLSTVEVQVSFLHPWHLSYTEFADLANYINYLQDHQFDSSYRFGSVHIKLREEQ